MKILNLSDLFQHISCQSVNEYKSNFTIVAGFFPWLGAIFVTIDHFLRSAEIDLSGPSKDIVVICYIFDQVITVANGKMLYIIPTSIVLFLIDIKRRFGKQ